MSEKIDRAALKLAQRIDAAWSMRDEAKDKGDYIRAHRMEQIARALEERAEKKGR